MGFLDGFKSVIKSEVAGSASNALNNAVSGAANAVKNASNKSEKFTFAELPKSVAQLQALPECSLDSPFKTAALAVAVLCNYESNPDETFAMLDVLKGPEPVNPYQKQFFKERLDGKQYKTLSFFEGATVENGYVPTSPYTITVSENPYSYPEENWATLFVKSSGADDVRPIKLRKKPSTGQWFLNDVQCLSDIRVPAAADPWA